MPVLSRVCVLPVVLHTSKENTFSKTTVFFLWFWFDRRRHGCLIARAHNEGVARFVSVIEYVLPSAQTCRNYSVLGNSGVSLSQGMDFTRLQWDNVGCIVVESRTGWRRAMIPS